MNDFLQSLRNGQAEKQRTPKTRKNFDNSYHYSSGPRYHSYGGGGGYQNTRNQQMKRPPAQHQTGNQNPSDDNLSTSMLADAIETLSAHIETLAKNQEFLINAQERSADMMERQAIAIERIVNHLNIASAPQEMQEEMQQENDADQKTFEHHYVTSQKEEIEMPAPKRKPVAKKAKPAVKKAKQVKQAKQVIRRRKKIVTEKPQKQAPQGDLLSRDEVMEIIETMREDGATFDQVASRLVELGQPTFSGRGEWHAQTIHRLCGKKK